MDEKRKKWRHIAYGAISAAVMIAASIALPGCGGGQKPERAVPITRLGDFYVGMPWEEATKYLDAGAEVDKLGLFYKEDPKRGEPVYGVRDEDKNVALIMDHTKTIIEIHKIDPSRNEDE